MVKLMVGKAGSGKTKEIIEKANASLQESKGDVIFIDESNEGLLEIHHNIRYINISEYPIQSSNEFLAYLYGLASGNYDIEKIFIDGIFNIFMLTADEIALWVQSANTLAEKFEIQITITLTTQEPLPDELKKFI